MWIEGEMILVLAKSRALPATLFDLWPET